MPTFSATAQSSSAIEVSWNLTDVDPGYLFDALSITQTAPDGQQTPQNLPPNDVVQIGTTLFTGLQPNTTYTYVIYAVWDDGQGGIGFTYNPQPGITCVTKAAQSASSGTQGTGSSSTNAGPALGPITGLTAKWNAPDYNQVTVDFTAGKNSTAAVTEFKGPSNYKTSTVIYRNAIQPPDKSVPISFAVEHLKPGAYTITVTETYKTYSNSATYYLAAPPPPGADRRFGELECRLQRGDPVLETGLRHDDDEHDAAAFRGRSLGLGHPAGTGPNSLDITIYRYSHEYHE
jgi:hypothetical protein